MYWIDVWYNITSGISVDEEWDPIWINSNVHFSNIKINWIWFDFICFIYFPLLGVCACVYVLFPVFSQNGWQPLAFACKHRANLYNGNEMTVIHAATILHATNWPQWKHLLWHKNAWKLCSFLSLFFYFILFCFCFLFFFISLLPFFFLHNFHIFKRK